MRPLLASLALAACAHPAPVSRCGAELVADQRDADALARCASLDSLAIRSGAKIDAAPLRSLAVIRGDLAIGPTVAVDELALPALREVGRVRVAANSSLHALFLPALERARAISIEGNVALATVSLPRLARVDGDLAITDCQDLELVDLTHLAAVGGSLTFTGDPKLALVEAEGPLAEKLRAFAVPPP